MSSITTAASPPLSPSNGTSTAQSPNQERLMDFCRSQGIRTPNFQIVSDRRGGRTAWSCVVTVQGYAPCPARFWYDGQYVNNAREDAAEKALQMFGVLPSPPGPAHLRLPPQQAEQQQTQ